MRENFLPAISPRPSTGCQAGEENVSVKLQTELMDYFGSVGVESEMTTVEEKWVGNLNPPLKLATKMQVVNVPPKNGDGRLDCFLPFWEFLLIFRGEFLLVSGSVLLDPIIMVQWNMAVYKG